MTAAARTASSRADDLLRALRRQVRRLGHAEWDRAAMVALAPSRAGPERFLLDYLDRFIELQRAFRGQDPFAPLRPYCGGMEDLSTLAIADNENAGQTQFTRLPDRRNFVAGLETMRGSVCAQLGLHI